MAVFETRASPRALPLATLWPFKMISFIPSPVYLSSLICHHINQFIQPSIKTGNPFCR
jgi:hypothetical protein